MKKTIQTIARAMLWPILKKIIRIKYRLFGLPSRKAKPYIVRSSQVQKLAAESKRIRIRLHETEQLIAAVKRQQQNSNKEFVKKKGFRDNGNNHQTLKIILLMLLISVQLHTICAQVLSALKPVKIEDKILIPTKPNFK